MATIVQVKETGKRYVLIGAGFGMYQTKVPHLLFGALAPVGDSGEASMALLCDEDGATGWIDTDLIEVVSIDGVRPGKLLEPHG